MTSATEHEYADLELKQTIEKQHDRVCVQQYCPTASLLVASVRAVSPV